VYRQLRQDVFAFRRFLQSEVARLSAQREFAAITTVILGARLVGRWKNGVPLVRSLDSDDMPQNRFEINHFRFLNAAPTLHAIGDGNLVAVSGADADDRGDRCPRSAHIRKSQRTRRTDRSWRRRGDGTAARAAPGNPLPARCCRWTPNRQRIPHKDGAVCCSSAIRHRSRSNSSFSTAAG
jgi:hypothetical protein